MVLNSQNLSQELLNDPYYATVENRLTRIGMLLGGLTLVVGALFVSWKFVMSFLLGAVISYLNFCWMKQGVDRLIGSFGVEANPVLRRPGRAVIFKYFLRYALIGGTLYAIFRFQFFEAQRRDSWPLALRCRRPFRMPSSRHQDPARGVVWKNIVF